jgi:hypothetical protein
MYLLAGEGYLLWRSQLRITRPGNWPTSGVGVGVYGFHVPSNRRLLLCQPRIQVISLGISKVGQLISGNERVVLRWPRHSDWYDETDNVR